jgi:hypothetical protein
MTVSKVVPVVLHVKMVAGPETLGVHWKTRSGELPLVAHVPASVLAPLVMPVKTPPAAGTTVGAAQPPPASVVDVVLVVVVTVVLVVVGIEVLVVVGTVVLVVVGIEVLVVVDTLVLVVVGMVVLVVVVGGAAGGTMVSWKFPPAPL